MDHVLYTANEMSGKCRSVFAIALYSVRKRFTSSRVICLLVMLCTYIWSNMTFVYEVTDLLEMRINPVLFPFLSGSPIPQLMIYAGVVFLYADAPFIDENQPYVIIRSNRTIWAFGQIVHVIISGALLFLMLMIFSLLIILPDATLATDGWGKVINTLAQTNIGEKVDVPLYISDKIVTAYSPMEAMVYCFLLNWAMTSFLGLMIFAANLKFGRMVGIVLGGVVLTYDLLVINTFAISYYYTSPLSLSRLMLVDPKGMTVYPSMTYAFGFFGTGMMIFSAYIILTVKKSSIEISSK